jgi:hypothetical protein
VSFRIIAAIQAENNHFIVSYSFNNLLSRTCCIQLLDFVVEGLSHVPFEALHAMWSVFHSPILHFNQSNVLSSPDTDRSRGSGSQAISLGEFLRSPKSVNKRVPSNFQLSPDSRSLHSTPRGDLFAAVAASGENESAPPVHHAEEWQSLRPKLSISARGPPGRAATFSPKTPEKPLKLNTHIINQFNSVALILVRIPRYVRTDAMYKLAIRDAGILESLIEHLNQLVRYLQTFPSAFAVSPLPKYDDPELTTMNAIRDNGAGGVLPLMKSTLPSFANPALFLLSLDAITSLLSNCTENVTLFHISGGFSALTQIAAESPAHRPAILALFESQKPMSSVVLHSLVQTLEQRQLLEDVKLRAYDSCDAVSLALVSRLRNFQVEILSLVCRILRSSAGTGWDDVLLSHQHKPSARTQIFDLSSLPQTLPQVFDDDAAASTDPLSPPPLTCFLRNQDLWRRVGGVKILITLLDSINHSFSLSALQLKSPQANRVQLVPGLIRVARIKGYLVKKQGYLDVFPLFQLYESKGSGHFIVVRRLVFIVYISLVCD